VPPEVSFDVNNNFWRCRMLGRFAGVMIAMALPLCAIAAETAPPNHEVVENSFYRLDLPKDWKIVTRGPPIQARGPHNELMAIDLGVPDLNVVSLDDPDAVARLKPVADHWQNQIRGIMKDEVTQDGMTVTEPLTETIMNGRPFWRIKAVVDKDGGFVSAYGFVGPFGTYFLVRVAGMLNDKAASESAAETMLQNIVWHAKDKE
jgi:hypothetical protein